MYKLKKRRRKVSHPVFSVTLQVFDKTMPLPRLPPHPAAADPASPYSPSGAPTWTWRRKRRMKRTRATTSSLLLSLDCSAQGLCSGAAYPTLTPSPASETADAFLLLLNSRTAGSLSSLDPPV